MDWKVFASTFGLIFLAELGDKTQFAALALSSQTKSTTSVLLGVVMALVVAGCLGVLAGRILGTWVDAKTMKYISGAAFMGMGLWTLLAK